MNECLEPGPQSLSQAGRRAACTRVSRLAWNRRAQRLRLAGLNARTKRQRDSRDQGDTTNSKAPIRLILRSEAKHRVSKDALKSCAGPTRTGASFEVPSGL
jgi:hypothetical protein